MKPNQIPIPDLAQISAMKKAGEMQQLNNLLSYAANLFHSQFDEITSEHMTAEQLAELSIQSAKIMFARLEKEVKDVQGR